MSSEFPAGFGQRTTLTDATTVATDIRQIVVRRAAGADATLAGYFVDVNGIPVSPDSGTTWTYTAAVSTTAILLKDLFSVVIPARVVGFRGRLTVADLIVAAIDGVSIPTALGADMNSNPTQYPLRAQSNDFRLGRA